MINISTEHMILTEVFDFKHIKELNGCERIYFETLHELKNEEAIYYADCVFIVKNIEKTLVGERIIYAIEALEKFYCDMIDLFEYSETTATLNLSKACDIIFSGTGWTYTLESNLTSVAFENFGNDSKSALFQNVLKRYKREFEVDYKNKNIYIAREIGKDESVVFRYKKNIVAISETVDTKELTTYIEAEGKDGLYVKYTSVNAEKFGVRHAKKIKDERYINIEELTEYARQSIQDVPLVAFEVDALVIDEELSLGDKVFVIHEKLGIDINARVLAIEEMPLDRQKRKTIKLGNFVETGFSDRVISKVEDYFDATSQADKDLQAKIDAANAAIDKEYNDRVQAVTDAIEKAEADAEKKKQEILDIIESDNEQFDWKWEQADKVIDDKLILTDDKLTQEISDRKKAIDDAIKTADSNARGFADKVQAALDSLANADSTQKINGNVVINGTIGADKLIANSITAGQIAVGTITANLMAAESILAGSLKVDQAMIDKLLVNDLLVDSMTAKQAFIAKIQAIDLSADRITSGTIDADLIKVNSLNGDRIVARSVSADKLIANSITAGEIDAVSIQTAILTADAVIAETIKVDQALINKLTVDDLLTNAITAKQAFITSVQAIDFQADRIVGGRLRSKNGLLEWNLNDSYLKFTGPSNAMEYTNSGSSAGISFGEVYSSVAGRNVPTVSLYGNQSTNVASNIGLDIMSGEQQINIRADRISFYDHENSTTHGFHIKTTAGDAWNTSIEPWSAGYGELGKSTKGFYSVNCLTIRRQNEATYSNYDMKENIREVPDIVVREVFNTLKVKEYYYKDETFAYSRDKIKVGLIIEDIAPEGNSEYLLSDGGNFLKSDNVAFMNVRMTQLLNAELNEALEMIVDLQQQINELKGA